MVHRRCAPHAAIACFVASLLGCQEAVSAEPTGSEHLMLLQRTATTFWHDSQTSAVAKPNGDAPAAGEPDTHQILEPGKAYIMYKHVELLQGALKQKGVAIWAQAGTLLGAVRNKGIIPHDNDADFTIFKADIANTLAALTPQESPDAHFYGKRGVMYAVSKWAGCPNKSANVFPKYASIRQWASPPCRNDKGRIGVSYWDMWKGKKYTSHIGIFIAEFLEAREVGTSMAETAVHGSDADKLAFEASLVKMPFGCSSVLVPGGGGDSAKMYLSLKYGADWSTAVNCKGTYHECNAPEKKEIQTWELTHMAQPCYMPW